MSTASIIVDDLPCRRCRYNLRTQATDGRCPECGTPVAVTLGTEPSVAPLLDSPRRRRVLALGCFGLAAALPAFVVANGIVHAFFHSVGIFWKVDPPYLLGPVSLLFAASTAILCLPQRRTDGTQAYRALRAATLALSLAVPLAVAAWEYAYAIAPFYRYEFYIKVSNALAIGAPISVALSLLLLASFTREWNVPDLPGPLRLFAAAWMITLLRPSQYGSWIPNVADFLPREMGYAISRFDALFTAVWIIAFADTIALLLCTGVVLRHSARLREAASRANEVAPAIVVTKPESSLPS